MPNVSGIIRNLQNDTKPSKSTKGLAIYDLFGCYDRLGSHLGFKKMLRRILNLPDGLCL